MRLLTGSATVPAPATALAATCRAAGHGEEDHKTGVARGA